MSIEFISIPAIAAIVGVIMQLYKKYIAKENENLLKIIPLIGIILGAGIGIGCFYCLPEIMSATTWFSALCMGAASGATATGVHQVIKQYLKAAGLDSEKKEETEEKSDKDTK